MSDAAVKEPEITETEDLDALMRAEEDEDFAERGTVEVRPKKHTRIVADDDDQDDADEGEADDDQDDDEPESDGDELEDKAKKQPEPPKKTAAEEAEERGAKLLGKDPEETAKADDGEKKPEADKVIEPKKPGEPIKFSFDGIEMPKILSVDNKEVLVSELMDENPEMFAVAQMIAGQYATKMAEQLSAVLGGISPEKAATLDEGKIKELLEGHYGQRVNAVESFVKKAARKEFLNSVVAAGEAKAHEFADSDDYWGWVDSGSDARKALAESSDAADQVLSMRAYREAKGIKDEKKPEADKTAEKKQKAQDLHGHTMRESRQPSGASAGRATRDDDYESMLADEEEAEWKARNRKR